MLVAASWPQESKQPSTLPGDEERYSLRRGDAGLLPAAECSAFDLAAPGMVAACSEVAVPPFATVPGMPVRPVRGRGCAVAGVRPVVDGADEARLMGYEGV